MKHQPAINTLVHSADDSAASHVIIITITRAGAVDSQRWLPPSIRAPSSSSSNVRPVRAPLRRTPERTAARFPGGNSTALRTSGGRTALQLPVPRTAPAPLRWQRLKRSCSYPLCRSRSRWPGSRRPSPRWTVSPSWRSCRCCCRAPRAAARC